MAKDITIIDIGDESIALHVTAFTPDEVHYRIGASADMSGTLLVKPYRYGMHPELGVQLTFGGYSGHVEIGDHALRGTILLAAPDMTPAPYPGTDQYPLGQVRRDDPATAEFAGRLATEVARHYVERYAGQGLR